MTAARGAVARLVATLVGLALVASACSSTPSASKALTTTPATAGSTSTTSTTLTKAQAAQRYLAIATPVNNAAATLQTQANGWTNSTTNVEMAADAHPVIQAITEAIPSLLKLAQDYPPAANDLKALVLAVSAVSGDLNGLADLNELNLSTWESQFKHDESIESAATATVRSDLGLPPTSG